MKHRGSKAPEPFGKRSTKTGKCGSCPAFGQLSQTHVPPRCAGNTGEVRRFHLQGDVQNRLAATKTRKGGIWFYGLCEKCNNAAGRWDDEYCKLSNALGLPEILSRKYPTRLTMPRLAIKPGAIAKSILAAAYALNPLLYDYAQRLYNASERENTMGSGLVPQLYLAATTGQRAIATGPESEWDCLRPNIALVTMAQVYFPPLAWQLADPNQSTLVHRQRWQNVTDWVIYDPDREAQLTDLISDLPVVLNPRWDPQFTRTWGMMHPVNGSYVTLSDNAGPTAP